MCTVVQLPMGSLVWVPYNYLMVPVVMETDEESAVPDLGSLIVVPMMQSKWLKEVPKDAQAAITKFNKAYFNIVCGKPSARPWVVRLREAFKELVD